MLGCPLISLSYPISVPITYTIPISIIRRAPLSPNTILPIASEPPRQLYPPKICNTNCCRRPSTQATVYQRTPEEMPAKSFPDIRQICTREPTNAQLQRQVISNDDLCCARRCGNAIRGRGVDDARSKGFGRGVDEEIKRVRDVEMRGLECAGQGKDERDVTCAA